MSLIYYIMQAYLSSLIKRGEIRKVTWDEILLYFHVCNTSFPMETSEIQLMKRKGGL